MGTPCSRNNHIGGEKSNLIFHFNFYHLDLTFKASIIVKCRTPIGTLRIMSLQRPLLLSPPELPTAGKARTKMTMSKTRGTKNLTKKLPTLRKAKRLKNSSKSNKMKKPP